MLVDEVRKRTRIHWPIVTSWPEGSVPVVAVGPERELAHFAGPYAQQPAAPNGAAEGYRIRVETTGRTAPSVLVIGNDARGVLFGVGRLLRELRMARDDVAIADDVNISTAPEVSATRTPARVPPENELVRRLGRADLGAIHQGPGRVRDECRRADTAAFG